MDCLKCKAGLCGGCLQCSKSLPDMDRIQEMDREALVFELQQAVNLCKQLEIIFESSSDTLFVTNHRGEILRVNAAWEKLSGASREEVLGKNIKDIVGTIISESSTLAALRENHSVTLEQTLIRSGRTSYTTSTPVYKDGALQIIVSNNRDFNEIERLKSRLEEEEKRSKKYLEEIKRIREELIVHDELIAEDRKTLGVIYRATKVAHADSSVLIVGETGTGKEEYAKYIHCNSPRKGEAFIRVNCGAIAPSLIESEFFGYEKGAFTGANTTGKRGLFEIADGGTIFLDEIGELPANMQVKLLRVLQEQEFFRVGGVTPIHVDVRILSATNKDLRQLIRDGAFREDLYYRLSVVVLEIPPLRDRPGDLLVLTKHFLEKLNQKYHTNKKLTSRAFQLLKSYSFPGNVRELKNCLEEAFVMSETNRIDYEDFSLSQQIRTIPIQNVRDLRTLLEKTEFHYLKTALLDEGSVRKAAATLGMSATTFARRLHVLSEKHRDADSSLTKNGTLSEP